MTRLLYNNFKPFRRWIDSLITEKLSAYDNKAHLELAFILEDQKYYRYTDEFKMPIDRQGVLQDHLTAMSSMLSGPELDDLITIFEKNLETFLNASAGKQRLKPLSELGFIVNEIKERKKVLFHPDIFNEIVACTYIREDEIGQPFNQKIHTQKLVTFETAKKKGWDPFYLKGLSAYIPLLKSMPQELKAYSQEVEPKVRGLQTMLKNLTLQQG